jgi:hypothetical protein
METKTEFKWKGNNLLRIVNGSNKLVILFLTIEKHHIVKKHIANFIIWWFMLIFIKFWLCTIRHFKEKKFAIKESEPNLKIFKCFY